MSQPPKVWSRTNQNDDLITYIINQNMKRKGRKPWVWRKSLVFMMMEVPLPAHLQHVISRSSNDPMLPTVGWWHSRGPPMKATSDPAEASTPQGSSQDGDATSVSQQEIGNLKGGCLMFEHVWATLWIFTVEYGLKWFRGEPLGMSWYQACWKSIIPTGGKVANPLVCAEERTLEGGKSLGKSCGKS